MRVDIHAYIGHWPFRQLRGNTGEGLLANMRRYGIDRAVISNINGIFYKNTQPANEELAEAVKPYPKEFIPFAVVNPTYPGWEHDFELCRWKLGFRGVRLYPQYHDYKLSDPRCTAAVRMATKLGMIVAFSVRIVDDRQRSWLDTGRPVPIDEIAAVVDRVPEGRYMVLNAALPAAGGSSAQIFKRANVLFDTVYATGTRILMGSYDLSEAVSAYGAQRFAFGTAMPFREPLTAQLRIEVSKELDAASKDLIWSGNALRFLGASAAGSRRLQNGVYAVLREAPGAEQARVPGVPHAVLLYDRKYSEADREQPPKYVAIGTSSFVPMILEGPPEARRDERGWTALSATLAREHIKTLEDFSRTHLGGNVAIVLDDEIITMHKVRSVITGGKFLITRCTDDACQILRGKLAAR